MLAFAAALWNSYGDEVSGRIGAGLMAAVSVGLILSGVFVTDAGINLSLTRGAVVCRP